MSRTSPFPDDAVPPWAGVVVAAVLLTLFLTAVGALKRLGDRQEETLRSAGKPVDPKRATGPSPWEAIRRHRSGANPDGQAPDDAMDLDHVESP